MNHRAAELVRVLHLEKHPEGGFFRELLRSARQVAAAPDGRTRSALTTIYYLLPEGDHSRWHRIESDEVWHFLEGDPLELFVLDPKDLKLDRHLLGPLTGAQTPVRAVASGRWQAARPLGAYTLAGCSVGPGFEFEDFRLLEDDPETSRRLRTAHPGMASLL